MIILGFINSRHQPSKGNFFKFNSEEMYNNWKITKHFLCNGNYFLWWLYVFLPCKRNAQVPSFSTSRLLHKKTNVGCKYCLIQNIFASLWSLQFCDKSLFIYVVRTCCRELALPWFQEPALPHLLIRWAEGWKSKSWYEVQRITFEKFCKMKVGVTLRKANLLRLSLVHAIKTRTEGAATKLYLKAQFCV